MRRRDRSVRRVTAVGVGRRSRRAAPARPRPPAVPYRSSGSLAMPRATTSSRAAGTRGFVALGRGGGSGDVGRDQMLQTVAGERRVSGQRLVQHARQRVDVDGGGGTGPLNRSGAM